MPASDQGRLTGRYTLIPRTLTFLTSGDKILLLKGSTEKPLWANLYNGIGGHLEKGEDALGGALRELREEAGLVLPTLRLSGIIIIDTDQTIGVGLYVFTGECNEQDAERIQNTPHTREGILEWIDQKELDRLPLVEDLYKLLPRLLAMKPDEPPLSGRYWYDTSGKLEIVFSN